MYILTKEYQDPAENQHALWFIIIQLIPGLHIIYQQTIDSTLSARQ